MEVRMLWIDTKYAGLISPKLDKWKVKQTNPFVANFRCPICGDSASNPNKARGYLLQHKNSMMLKCHNCGISMGLDKLIEKLDSSLYQQYKLEKFGKKFEKKSFDFKPKFETKSIEDLPDFVENITNLDVNHPAVLYCKSRKLPDYKLKYIYYIDDVSRITEVVEKYKNRIKTNEGRIVLPFYSKNNDIVGFTMRAIDKNPLRYITIRLREDEPMIYGLERINLKKKIVCVEGPIDSLFLSNAVAVSGADMKKATEILPKNTIYVFDNQPRNKTICNLLDRMIRNNYTVCIWPNNLYGKDINDMVLTGYSVEKIIYNNSYSDLSAMLKFNERRKV